MNKTPSQIIAESESYAEFAKNESYPDAMYRFLDDAIKRRAFGEFIPLPLFDAIMEMVNTLPNTKLNHRGYPDTYSVAAALENLRRLRPLPTEEKMEYQREQK